MGCKSALTRVLGESRERSRGQEGGVPGRGPGGEEEVAGRGVVPGEGGSRAGVPGEERRGPGGRRERRGPGEEERGPW